MKINWIVFVALAVFVALVFGVAWPPPAGYAAPPAPIDAAALFKQRCSPCHGPNAEGTKIAPALTHLGDHTDEELFQIISEGVTGTAMPVWKTVLSADEIRAVVPYLRSLGNTAGSTMAPAPAPVTNSSVDRKLAVVLELDPSANGVVLARATVQDSNAKPVANAPVALNLLTALGGRLEIGSAKTDSQGIAVIEYRAGEGRTLTLEASAGQGMQAVTTSATTTTLGGEVWTPAALISPNPPVPEVALLGVVLGGVWLTYAFVGRQLLGIFRNT